MARSVLPVEFQTDLKAIEKGIAEMAMTDAEAVEKLTLLQNVDGSSIYLSLIHI